MSSRRPSRPDHARRNSSSPEIISVNALEAFALLRPQLFVGRPSGNGSATTYAAERGRLFIRDSVGSERGPTPYVRRQPRLRHRRTTVGVDQRRSDREPGHTHGVSGAHHPRDALPAADGRDGAVWHSRRRRAPCSSSTRNSRRRTSEATEQLEPLEIDAAPEQLSHGVRLGQHSCARAP